VVRGGGVGGALAVHFNDGRDHGNTGVRRIMVKQSLAAGTLRSVDGHGDSTQCRTDNTDYIFIYDRSGTLRTIHWHDWALPCKFIV
jgi:hypothetical protein